MRYYDWICKHCGAFNIAGTKCSECGKSKGA